MRCNDCPRQCNALRTETENRGGACKMPLTPRVARVGLHRWEEPCISGTRGSGAVFFSGCPLRCVFCQNEPISHGGFGKPVPPARLAELFAELEAQGAHNINLVSPTHFIRPIAEALEIYRPRLPIVYNTGGYDLPAQIERDLFDVYLFDLKYISPEKSARYSGAGDYFRYAAAAIETACRLTGEPMFDENGLLQRGVIVRHLLLPQATNEAIAVFDWVHEHAPQAIFSLMAQYVPSGKAAQYPEINRKITKREYEKVTAHLLDSGAQNVYLQERSSADVRFVPDFDLTGL